VAAGARIGRRGEEEGMNDLMQNPAFQTYALCSAILALKMLLSAVATTVARLRTSGYANAEDARTFGAKDPTPVETPAVAHMLRIQRNDGENIPMFFAIGLLYVLIGASPFGASVYFWTFTIARVLHTVTYMAHLQPWRAICYGVGVFCVLGMAAQIIGAAA
jgi:glutathione S-transferase